MNLFLPVVTATGPRVAKAAHYLQCRLAGGRTENPRKLAERPFITLGIEFVNFVYGPWANGIQEDGKRLWTDAVVV
jgi:hypothetical protein